MQNVKASTVDQCIVPPANPWLVQLTMVDNGGVLGLAWNGQTGNEVDLRYTPPDPAAMVMCLVTIQMLDGWTIDPGSIAGSPIVWSHPQPLVWTALVSRDIVARATQGTPTIQDFTFIHTSGRRHDPRIIVERED